MTGLNESVISKAFGLPSEGQQFCDNTVLASGVDIENNRWFVITDGTVQRTAAQEALKPSLNRTKYFTYDDRVFEAISGPKFQMEVVRTNPSGGVQTVIGGSMSYTRVRKNPVSVADFRSEMNDMFVSDPRRDFKEYDAPKLHSEAFRDRLFTFVSYRGESYGWVKGGKIYHRRGSLIMPKLKVNKAVEGATVFYHTHPSKDEPSLSSADDYQFYADLAFAFGIKHFYTIMENRIDHFTFSVKKSKEEDYLKMDEDKLLDDLNAMIDEAEASVTKKHKGNKNMTDEKFYETITRSAVTKMNSRFKQFFTITYKGHAKPGLVRENPGVAGFRHNPPVRISHIHRASQLDELRDTTNNYEHYGANEFGHSHYVYWWIDHHFSATPAHPKARLWKLKEYGLSDEARRKLRAYMSEEVAPGYSKLDILLFLALYHDVGKKREKEEGRHHSIIGAEMFRDEISVELKLPEQVTDIVVHLMMTDVGRKNIDPEVFRTKAGDYLGVAYMLQLADMLAHHPFMYTSYAAEAKEQGLIDKANVHRYKQFAAEQHISNVTKFLNSRVINNPPPKAVSAYYIGSFGTAIDGDIAQIEFSEWEDPDKPMFYNAQLRMRDPVFGTKLTLFLREGKFNIYFGKDSNRIEGDATFYDTAMDIYRRMGDILSNFTTGMDYESPPEPAIMVNPRHVDKVHLITISGPSGVGKSTIAKTLAGILDADLIPTVTTRPRRPKEKGNRDRIFITEKQFKEMIEDGAFVEWKRLKNGFYYGRRYSDFKKPVAVIDVTLKGMKKYRDVFPHTTSIFLDPDVSPEELKKRILRRGGMTPEEAEARANIAAKQIEDAHKMDFDMFVKSKTGGFEDVAKQIAADIEKQNPSTNFFPGEAVEQYPWLRHADLIKQNAPIFDALPSPEEYVAQRIQAGSKLTPNGHQFRNTVSSSRSMGLEGASPREIISLAFTRKVQGLYEPFKQDAQRVGFMAIKAHVNKERYPRIPDWDKKVKGDWANKVWTIDEMIENGGVCRHLALLSGLLLERAIEDGVLKGQVYYFRGPGHGWAVFRDQTGRDFLIDPAQGKWQILGDSTYWDGEEHRRYADFSKIPDSLPQRTLRGLQAQASPEMKAMLRSNPKEGPDLFSHFERWAKLVNMKNKELKAFLDSPLGKVAGLSPQEAKEQGIFSGRVSGRRILKMRAKIGLGGPKDYIKGPRHLEQKWEEALKKWTGPSKDYMNGTTDWDWCMRQVRFNTRHGAFPYNKAAEDKKGPLIKKQKTQNQVSRRLLGLWVWGHDPWRWARKHGIARMPKCPDVPWVGMTEKRKYGKVPVLMKPTKKNPWFPSDTSYPSALTAQTISISQLTNPQTGLPGIGEPPVDPATIQPHLDWPMWTKPDWFPRNLVPQSAVFSPARTTTVRGRKMRKPAFYYIRQDELNRLLQSQQYLELQEAERQRKIAEAERIRAQHQGTVEDYRTNPRIPKKYEGQDPSEHSDLYTDEEPTNTIQGLGFKDKETALRSINIIRRSGKTHAHKIQAAMAMEQRARFHPSKTKGIREAQKVYERYIEEMKEKTKERRNPRTFSGIKEAHEHYGYAGSHRTGTIIKDGIVIRTYSNNEGHDIVKDGGDVIRYMVKTPKIRSAFLTTRKQGKHLRFFLKTGPNEVTDMGMYEVGRLSGDFVNLRKASKSNPPNIPFPVPEEYQEELERRLTEEMTAEGYRPLRVQQDFIDSGGYDDAPSDWSYVQGEYQEFLDEIEAQDWDEAYAEYSDVEGHTAYYLWTNYRIDMPVYTHDHIDKVLFRIRIFEDLFAHYGFEFGPQYLKGGSNYEKVFKVRNALDAAADAQGKPRVTDDDEQLGAVVKQLVAARKARNNPAPMGLEADFEAMKRTAKRNRELEMTEGFDAHGWWKSQKGVIDEKYGKEAVAGASWLMPVFDPDFDPYADPNSIDDFYPDGEPNMHFYNQLMRIPQTAPPTPRKILQIALNIGQGQATGTVNEDYTMSDFIAFDNPRTPGGKKVPTRYLKGLTKLERMIAEDEIDKGYKYDTDDPEAYKFWKSDIKATARGLKIGTSKHRTKYYKMYRKNIDKDYKPAGKSPKEKFLNRIRKETKIKRSILEKIYDKGLAAWRTGHRPGVAQHQWAAGRVYAFAVGADSSTGKGKPDHKLAVEAGVR